jgi:hypothetical protein
MAHAIWHIDPSYIGRYWKDKLMGGALATQEGLIDPMVLLCLLLLKLLVLPPLQERCFLLISVHANKL